jgi:hypothetical protein
MRYENNCIPVSVWLDYRISRAIISVTTLVYAVIGVFVICSWCRKFIIILVVYVHLHMLWHLASIALPFCCVPSL